MPLFSQLVGISLFLNPGVLNQKFRTDGNSQPRVKLRMRFNLAGTVNRLNVEHRTSNIERPMFDVNFFVYPSYEIPQDQSLFSD